MQIIPVIDLMGGQVVHARGGQRSLYQPVSSILTQSFKPFEVIADLQNFYPFSHIYIADLDAIEHGHFNIGFYQQLVERFSHVEFWVDSGIPDTEQFMQRAQISSLRHVVGSETLQELTLLQQPLFKQQGIMSLDFKAGKLLGQQHLLTESTQWPHQVIVMSLDMVGSGQGPDEPLLKKLQNQAPKCCFFAAGGVRDETDLARLAQQDIAGALVASCLHNGKLGREQIDKYRNQAHRLP